jgi:hypothetical protein
MTYEPSAHELHDRLKELDLMLQVWDHKSGADDVTRKFVYSCFIAARDATLQVLAAPPEHVAVLLDEALDAIATLEYALETV